VPDPDPLDCNGHGSHVAGSAAGFGVTAAGNTYTGAYDGTTHSSSFRIGPGVAPRALLHAYRVFGCDGSSATSVIVAAINRAVVDNVDVINMSIGSPFTPPDDAFSMASDAASAAGVTVVGSAGNEGPSGYITGGAGAATRALSVAALDATGPTIPGATIDGPSIPDQDPATAGDQPITGINANDGPLPVSGTLLVLHNTDGSMSLGCEETEYAGAAGKIVVTLRGVCARVARAEFGDAAGAIAVIMVNNGAGLPPFEGPIAGVDIPFIGVAPAAGPVLDAANGTAVTINSALLPNAGYQRSASFTSGGPRNDDSAVKPEVSAPGVSLVSTGVGTGNGSATLSGTSMAAPHTAGAAALVVQAHPTWTPNQVKAALMNTADATASKILGYNLRLAGNGVIAARRAVDTVALATTSDNLNSLTFGYQPSAAGISQTRSFTIANTSGSDITYELSGAFNGSASGATIAVSPTSVTVGANSSATVEATVTMSAAAVTALPQASTFSMLAAGFAWGGVLTVRGAITAHPTTAATGRYDLRVPFMLVPRGLSGVMAGNKAPYTTAQGISRSSVLLSNTGGHSSDADVYAWGISDPNEGFETMDIRTVGAQTLPGGVLGGAAGDRSIIFAINTYGRFTNASVAEYDIVIDTNKNGKPDFFVVGVDFGAVTADAFDGRFASFIFNAKGDLVNAWIADGPMNGSTVLLPTLASDIGLKQGNSNFRYGVSSFPIVEDAVGFDSTALAAFDSHKPGVSSGQFIPLAPGATATLNLAVDHGKFQSAPAMGWLVVALDDANGAAQADQIPLGNP
jgi:subtilisin family serine protease